MKQKQMSIKTRRAISGYLFILPFIMGFLFFMVYPLINSFWMSLCNVEISARGFNPVFTGLTNYITAFTVDPEFNELLATEVGRMATNSIATIVVAFMIALVLNQEFKGRAFVRAIFFLPVILSSGVLVGLETDNTLMSGIADMITETTPFTLSQDMMNILRLTGIGGDFLDVVFDLVAEVNTIVMASGIQIVVFLTGLQNIPRSLYEAADVEGCTKWESFWKITFPMVSPLLVVNIIYTIIDFFMKTDNEVMEKIRDTMVIQMNYGFASAMAWIYFLVAVAMIGISSLIISKGVVQSYE